jgi:L-2-hydroxyglutarate oxidase LhgO
MSLENKYLFKECIVIGAGISGIALGKWLKVLQSIS